MMQLNGLGRGGWDRLLEGCTAAAGKPAAAAMLTQRPNYSHERQRHPGVQAVVEDPALRGGGAHHGK